MPVLMNTYNPQIHHRRSIRLKGYDYSQAGWYFVTICCHGRACLFGDVINNKMVLNEYGQIANNEWMKTPDIRPNVELGEFIIMPNHVHGIIRLLCRGELHSPLHNGVSTNNNIELHSPLHNGVSTNNNIELHSPLHNGVSTNNNINGECDSPLQGPSNTIGAIIRGYKSSVTKQLNLLNIGCAVWQRNYYEHIIRNEQSYQNISKYIINNPAKWSEDKFYLK
jgi:REP element-mobilizing transposase RayT